MTRARSFASDNNAPIAPEILQAIAAANDGDAPAYGDDEWSARAIARFREQFGDATDVYFAFNGTGANVAALSSVLHPWEAVLCPSTAHLHTDECGALERFCGSKVIPIPTGDGKLRPAEVEPYLRSVPEVHFSQPRALSISQATELGGIYEIEELRELCAFAHERGLLVHVDGARLANAAAALEVPLRTLSVEAGADLLTLGGTKNGLMLGDVFCFFSPGVHGGAAPYVQKQAMQLASKMRFIAAQYEAFFARDLWRRYAAHANAMAALLAERVREMDGIQITRAVRSNAVFATMNPSVAERLQRDYAFVVFDERLPEVRWMTHWATTPADVDAFIGTLKRELAR
ncbi:MAG: threonine aldolase [Candidatus Eremiobacteraeota bacterium]|nr:threonine aldolase [Candidatus Eremiobacteraeota bacterium]MBV8374522.1 threonine aldolase [Candidatus Eremiobacteraeota bacterium]